MKRKIISAIILSLCSLCLFTAGNVFAEAGDAPGSSRKATTGFRHSASMGATWAYYSYTGSADLVAPGWNHGNTSTIRGKCGEYGGFYLLVYLEYNASNDQYTGRTGGSTNLSRLQPMGGNIVYKTGVGVADSVGGANIVSSGEDLATVEAKFNSMPDEAKNGFTWDSNSSLGWFCYGDGAGGKVYSTSEVTFDGNGANSISGLDSKTTMYVSDTVMKSTGSKTAHFTHRIVSVAQPTSGLANINIWWTVSGDGAGASGSVALDGNGWTKRPDGYWEKVVYTSASIHIGDKICQKIVHPKDYTMDGATSGQGESEACISTKEGEDNPTCDELEGGSDKNINFGNTNGNVKVNNMNSSEGWQQEVFARPGDTVKFAHCFSWGIQKVTRSTSYGAARGKPDSENADPRSDEMPYNWYRIFSLNGDSYLFGLRKDQGSIGEKITLERFKSTAIRKGGSKIKTDNPEYNRDYELVLYSPTNQDVDEKRYECAIYDFASQFIAYGFHIPGFRGGSCAASEATGQTNQVVDGGPSFSQSIEYEQYKMHVYEYHKDNGDCQCSAPSPQADARSVTDHYDNYGSSTYPGHSDYGSWNYEQWDYLHNEEPTNETYETVGPNGAGKFRTCRDTTCDWGVEHQHVDYYAVGQAAPSHPYDLTPPSETYDPDTNLGCDAAVTIDNTSTVAQYAGDPATLVGYVQTVTHGWKQTCHGRDKYKYSARYPVKLEDDGPIVKTALVHVPYNYDTRVTSGINSGDVVYPGEPVDSIFTATLVPRINTAVKSTSGAYATLYPGNLVLEQFIIPADRGVVNLPSDGVMSVNGSICNTVGGVECGSIGANQDENWLNREGRYQGWSWGQTSTYDVPNNVEIGSKYCVAIGFTSADSHSQPDAGTVDGDSHINGNWRVSMSCRTIAKKPTFQAWGSNVFSDDDITTSITNKYEEAVIGSTNPPNRTFGSWAEYLVTSNGDIYGFGSGSAFGYQGKNLQLPGGMSPVPSSQCKYSNMSISNEKCDDGSTKYVGHAKIGISNSVLSRLFARYVPGGKLDKNTGSSINVADARDLATTSGSVNKDTTVEYLATEGNASIDHTITRSTGSKGLIIYVPGTLTIKKNICYGSGTCSSNQNSNLVLKDRNSQNFSNIKSLPQVIIIANNINIDHNVTQIDAWLIALAGQGTGRGGEIDTCVNFGSEFTSETCGRQLIVNGPVVANKIYLNRTAGAYTRWKTEYYGQNNNDSASNNLSNDGGLTSAEIFNFRPDVLLWSYYQSQNYSQATVTYSRELSPRY